MDAWLDSDTAPDEPNASIVRSERAPWWLLLSAFVALLAAGALLVTSPSNPLLILVAWLLAGPVSILLCGAFIHQDAKRRARATVYHEGIWGMPAYTLIVVAGVAVAGLAAWDFADWVGRL